MYLSAIRHSVLLIVALSTAWAVPGANHADAQTESHHVRPDRLSILPPENFASSNALLLETAADSLTESRLLSHLSSLYALESRLLSAIASGDSELHAVLLDSAMTGLGNLLSFDGVRLDPRFQDLYRILVGEYEREFGVSDTLFVAFGEIFDVRSEMFTALDRIQDPLLEDVLSPEIQPVQTTVEMTVNRLVESSIAYLLKEPEKHMLGWLSRADTYLPMIERIFQEEGVPDELKYLGMIESGLNPRARSWARAAGMWQFIAGTGRHYGLVINSWVDERMDPEKSTRAAAKHLLDLRNQYGNWHTALAGYNCSPRCIKRAVRRAKSAGHTNPTYWDLYRYLPRETRNYIPTYIATALIASNPEAFNLPLVKPGPAYEYHLVPVRGMLSLRDLAGLAGTDVATMKALNPNLRRSTLPPSTGAFYLRIPAGTYDRFQAAYEALPESARRPSGEYVVKRGDTLGHISRRYGVSVSRLMQKNGLRSTRIGIGQRLIVPLTDYSQSPPATDLPVSTGALVAYGRRSNRPIALLKPVQIQREKVTSATPVVRASQSEPSSANISASNKPASNSAGTPSSTRTILRVKRGDTLGRIAGRYGVSIRQLQQWNGLSGSRIYTNQKLTVYTDPASAPATSGSEPIIYRVRSGDTLSGIAVKHGVTISQLRRWNKISGSRIRVGQRLTIRPSNGNVTIHTVRRGDTLIKIAGRYATTVARIKDWNNLHTNLIRPGQELRILQ